MPLRFTVLASGSAGNASLLEAGEFGVLIDAGLGPRQIAHRLAETGAQWSHIHAVVLTHTHGDHWRDATFTHMARRGVPLYCHREHQENLLTCSAGFVSLREAGLVRNFNEETKIDLSPKLRCRALPVLHDGGPTFGFRFEGEPDLFGNASSLAYAADLGSWDDGLASNLANVDLLALEFNHDLELEHNSSRSAQLIERVLGDHGHLSNVQAADLVRAVLTRSQDGRLRHLVQLHLSRECNRPHLAFEAAQAVAPAGVAILTAEQDAPCPTVVVGAGNSAARLKRHGGRRLGPRVNQPFLPGFDQVHEAFGKESVRHRP